MRGAGEIALRHTDEGLHVVPHGVSWWWCDLWQWIAPVAGLVGGRIRGTRTAAHRHVRRHLRQVRRARRHPQPPSVQVTSNGFAMLMDGMVGHGEIADPHPDAVAPAHHQGDRCRGTPAYFQVHRLNSVMVVTRGT